MKAEGGGGRGKVEVGGCRPPSPASAFICELGALVTGAARAEDRRSWSGAN
jgi:hypothetical protein